MQSLIAIPTYQRAHQIVRAVEAALAQSQHDVSVVVIDDGSTDATEAACARWFGHPRFGYLKLERNMGTAAAKNVALALLPFDEGLYHALLGRHAAYPVVGHDGHGGKLPERGARESLPGLPFRRFV